MAATTLVLGLGNTIMADDGVGPCVIEYVARQGQLPSDVELLDGGTLGLDLLPRLEGVQRLIIVDAVEIGQAPGTLVRLSGEDVSSALDTKLSPHQMGLKDLLAVARLLGHLPDEVVLLGVQPASIEMAAELSPQVAACLPQLAAMVRQELRTALPVA
jgi:hydrogenase maturation protease